VGLTLELPRSKETKRDSDMAHWLSHYGENGWPVALCGWTGDRPVPHPTKDMADCNVCWQMVKERGEPS
jgi:hypothetical protein